MIVTNVGQAQLTEMFNLFKLTTATITHYLVLKSLSWVQSPQSQLRIQDFPEMDTNPWGGASLLFDQFFLKLHEFEEILPLPDPPVNLIKNVYFFYCLPFLLSCTRRKNSQRYNLPVSLEEITNTTAPLVDCLKVKVCIQANEARTKLTNDLPHPLRLR